MSWTDERVELLRRLWGEGRTAAEIARELGDVTRNAVIGKAHRLKLSNRVSPIQQNTKKSTTTKAISSPGIKPSVAAKAMVNTAMSNTGGVSMAELKDIMCKWPIGDPRDSDFHFCGAEGVPGLPYCTDHAKIAYQAASRKRVLKAKDFEDNGKKKMSPEEELKEAVA